MGNIKGNYTFVTVNGKVCITCNLEFARWLIDTERTHGGVFSSAALRIYM